MSAPKRIFTLRRNGEERTTLRVDVYLTREQWEVFCELAAEAEDEPASFLRYYVNQAFEGWLERRAGEYYGRKDALAAPAREGE